MQDLVYGSSDVDESGPPGDNEKVASAAKQKELDATIAQMAYQRRLQALRSEFGHDEKSQFDTRELKRVIAELEVARAKDALEESKDRLKMYAENPK
ncbi:hypothetical protein [Burkholderia sp. LMG 32019]